ncbi:MAG: hypothetical protein J6N76_07910 [Lachnospiraceae bacterium]|nr:hypothetical protein [Lachnospiraceae bacterium]
MNEIVRQYGGAYLAVIIVVFILAVIMTIRITGKGQEIKTGIRQAAGEIEKIMLEDEEELTESVTDIVSIYTERKAAGVSTAIALIDRVYRTEELIKSDSGKISVISVERADKKCTREVFDSEKNTFLFDKVGRYKLRYRIADDAAGREGARRTGNVCIFVRGDRNK